jgi:hypothetical protein
MSNYKANPIVAPAITRPGESAEYVGTRDVTKLLPVIFQTPVNRKFLENTLEQLMSSGSLQAINQYVGIKSTNNKINEDFLKTVSDYQFVPAAVNRDNDKNITNVLTYDDMLNAFKFNEANVNNHNTLLNEKGYTLDIPINYDMFINYHRYYWLVDMLPVCDIKPTAANKINIDDITQKTQYTTPVLSNGKTLELQNGMRVRFALDSFDVFDQTVAGNTTFTLTLSDAATVNVYLNNGIVDESDYTITGNTLTFNTAPAVNDEVEVWFYYASGTNYSVENVYIVDGVGSENGIVLTLQYTAQPFITELGSRVWLNQTIYTGRVPSKFDADDDSFDFKPFDFRDLQMVQREYVVEQRFSRDQSAWARSNLWIHEEAAIAVCDYAGVDPTTIIVDSVRAVRPIIEYRANMKKYNYGERHIANVTFVFDTVNDPATEIVGKTEWDFAEHTITNVWEPRGYNKGDIVRVITGTYISYWDCTQTHTTARNPTHSENFSHWRQVMSKPIADGDTILFLDSGTSYDNKIWLVGGVDAQNITLTELYNLDGSNGATQINTNDKIMAIIGYNSVFNETYDGLIYNGSEWYWNGSAWVYGQQKDHRSEGAMFMLYDMDKTALDNSTVYPDSNFAGDPIFDYDKSNGKYDEALGFSPVYVDYGNNPGFQFKFGLGSIRYTFNDVNETLVAGSTIDATGREEIQSNYYYKDLITSVYFDGWKEIRNGQRIFKHKQVQIENAPLQVSVNLGTTDIFLDDKFIFSVDQDKLKVASSSTLNSSTRVTDINGVNPVLFVSKGRTYFVQTLFDASDLEIVNFDGSATAGVTVTSIGTRDFQFVVDANISVDTLRYRLVSDNTVSGLICLNDNTNNTTLQVYLNGEPINLYSFANGVATTSLYEEGDTLDFYWYTDSELSDAAEGEFEVAGTHIYNPQNGRLQNASFGDLITHMRQQMQNIPGFNGEFFGSNNYRHLPHVHEFGGTIRRQPYSTEALTQMLMDTDTNPYSSLKYVGQSYRRFISAYLQKARQLHNELDTNTPVYELVDRVLEQLNLGKVKDTAFSYSNMVMYRKYESKDYTIYSGQSTTVELPMAVNVYNDTKNHIQLWLKDLDGSGSARWRALIKNVDYTLADDIVTISSAIVYDSNDMATVHVRWYPIDSYSFVPPSAAKLGLVKPHVPQLVSTVDTNSIGVFSGSAIIGHDGAVYDRYGTDLFDRNASGFNIDDAVIWELETRIYNNLDEDLDTVVDYKKILPTANRPTVYGWNDLTAALRTEFNKWKIRNNVTGLQEIGYYDPTNKFTWNYSSVAPFIGGYRGIYNYFFNTDTPHLTPWEMFGYNKKPTWWDTYYSWTTASKRTALIEALKTGHYNNPAETYAKHSIDYAYTAYDWDSSELVTTSGVLNDPVTANVVAEPTGINAGKPFVFGDWGQIETVWRNSSEYKLSLFVALMKLRPLWISNNYFESTRRRIDFIQGFDKEQIYFSDIKSLKSFASDQFTYAPYEDAIIEYINVKNGGSYTTTPTAKVYGNFGYGAVVRPVVRNQTITAASVLDPGSNYQSKPTIVLNDGNAVLEPVLTTGALKYFNGMSNAIIEYAKYNKTTVDDLIVRFNNLTYNPVIKTNGFVNINNQHFILESSQDKGRVFIPEENYNSLLHVNQPNEELFFGAIKITRTSAGYKIAGYDNSDQYFRYNAPNENSRKTVITINEENYDKYKEYESFVSELEYNTVLRTIQEVYNFILGYGHYLNKQGWEADWTNTGARFAIWAQTAPIGDSDSFIPNVSGIQIRERAVGYYDSLNNKYDGNYNLIGKNGEQILSNRVIIARDVVNLDDPKTTINVKDVNETEIYGVRLYNVSIEHAIVFDNKTDFDDLIYEPELGLRHNRVIWRGSKTKGWNGKLYAPGFIVNNNTIVNNFDTTAGEIDQYYGRTNTLNNKQISDVARFNTGYNKPAWAAYTTLDDDTLFEFYKGTRKYKGTRFAFDAFMRNNDLFGSTAVTELYEEWALRTADYGDLRSSDTLEFELTPDLLTTNPQPIRFIDGELNDVLTDLTIDVDSNSPLLVTGLTGNNFRTRPAKTYNTLGNDNDEFFARDFVTAGLPLTTETDYRVINREDFAVFPTPARDAYVIDGEWLDIKQWDNKKSYKYKDKVIYEGRVWEMLDPDGSSGLNRPNNPIIITGTITLPVVSGLNETLVIDGNTVTLQKNATSTTFNLIQLTATNNIGSTAVVPHGSTVILGTTSNNSQTIQFQNFVSSVEFQTVSKTGTVVNPQIVGSATKQLVIDNTAIQFNQTENSTSNITAQAAYEDAFLTSWTVNDSTSNIVNFTSQRISIIENLRSAYSLFHSVATWETFINNYFSSTAGLNINFLLNEYATADASYESQLEALIENDVQLINNILNRSYDAANVIDGTETILASDITVSRSALAQGAYTANIANWLTSNPNTTFTSNVFVATTTTQSFITYSLTQIVNRINAAGIPNVTASAVDNRLRIVKTPTSISQSFSLVINSANANSEVGFNTNTQTISSTGLNIVNTAPLTISQVIEQINAAQITGVSVRAAPANSNFLQIVSNNEQLYIGNGTANSIIGITQGVTPATLSVNIIPTNSDLTDIIESINSSNIPGVTASNSGNKLRLTSTNSTLVIGVGTANSDVGFVAQTYTATKTIVSNVFNAIVGSDGNQVFREMENDPNVFSIWVADNSEQYQANLGYAVYQTMSFGMSIAKACAGITDADDAQIVVSRPEGTVQAHNLQAGDYVLIRGSNTVPSIDGIHRVTSSDLDSNLVFYIDKYIQKEGDVGNIYPIRNVRFRSYQSLLDTFNTTVNGVYKYNFSGYRQNNTQQPIYAFVDDDGTGRSAVYTWRGQWNESLGHYGDIGWKRVRQAPEQARNDLVKNVKIYDAERKSLITTIETFDPAKGIIPGFIDNEIDFKLTADIANYNYDSINGFKENETAWSNPQVGLRWWDLTTAIYLDYEQSSIDYQQNNWGRLFDGATVDIYEWTQSPVIPEKWVEYVESKRIVNGQVATGEPYSIVINGERVYRWTEQTWYNPRRRATETSYFFWVKNKTTSIGNRNYNVLQLSKLLETPTVFDITWCAASNNDKLLLSNVERFVDENTVAQINQIYEGDALQIDEWTLVADGDPDTHIPEYFHIKVRDSLVGYNRESRLYTYTDYNAATNYQSNVVVKYNNNFYLTLSDNVQGITPDSDTQMTYWKQVYDYSIPADTPHDDILVLASQQVPDINLHPYNRYGHLIRPRQSLYRDVTEARQNFVEALNSVVKEICIVDEINNWDDYLTQEFIEGVITYKLNNYWTFVDYVDNSYNVDEVPDVFVNLTVAEAGPDLPDGTTVYVKTVLHSDGLNRPEIYKIRNGDEPLLVWKKNGTIKFSEELWNQAKYGHGFDVVGFDVSGFDSDTGNIVAKLFDVFRYNLFIGQFKSYYNKLWFKCLYQAVTQNTTDDFAFKTTYTKVSLKHPVLLDKKVYQRFSTNVIEDFYNSIKPFHTKLRSVIDSNTYREVAELEITDSYRNEITMTFNDHSSAEWVNSAVYDNAFGTPGYVNPGYVEDQEQTVVNAIVLSGGNFITTTYDTELTSEFTTIDDNLEYVYNGNKFEQPEFEGWGEELYPLDMTENIKITVQTNSTGSSPTADTRTFALNYYYPANVHEATVITQAAKTTVTEEINATSTQIEVADASALTDPASIYSGVIDTVAVERGVIWIGSERIEYGAIEGNTLLYCVRGTRGTSTQTHEIGATVTDYSWPYRIPTTNLYTDYQNALRPAYNDPGISLSSAGTSPEHEFIRNAGFGTL